jgi:hypothetical protein
MEQLKDKNAFINEIFTKNHWCLFSNCAGEEIHLLIPFPVFLGLYFHCDL